MAQKTATVEVLAGFVMPGRGPAQIGETLTIPEGLARELLAAHKVRRVPARPDPVTLSTQIPRGLEIQTPKLDTPEAVTGKKFKS